MQTAPSDQSAQVEPLGGLQAPRIGLALSGGGFRATLFHLGLLRYLRQAGLLTHVKYITSVSGGSIAAAHAVLRWDNYTGPEQEWRSALRPPPWLILRPDDANFRAGR